MTRRTLAVTLRRRDGVTLGFTDQETTLVVDGVPHAPAPIALADGVATFGVEDLPPVVTGVLDDDALSAVDLDAGLWDGADVRVRRVDLEDPSVSVIVMVGRLGAVRRGDGVFEAEIEGPKAALARPIGRVFARTCDADLGDARCGVDLTAPANAGAVCDKTLLTCRTRFGNAVNFRGFPHMIGPDVLVRAADADGPADGGARG
ncbi:MAG: DUF2163 domain-containing protein [Alphaproteobacteria bacterium]|nr:DUF2163 domain-containing protein [Alphaproteobacteria bacterium]